MVDLWREHEYHPLLWAEADILADSAGHLRLEPEQD